MKDEIDEHADLLCIHNGLGLRLWKLYFTIEADMVDGGYNPAHCETPRNASAASGGRRVRWFVAVLRVNGEL